MVEDTYAGVDVIGHLVVAPEEVRSKYSYYYSGLIWHHTLTIMAYSWSLYSHKLSGLCVFGLLFELPVVFLNVRDILATFDNWLVFHDTKQAISDKTWYIMWIPIYVTWHCTRSIACMLWPLSLIIWRPELNTLPIFSRLVYHFLGFMFNVVNVKLLYEVVPQCAFADIKRTVSRMNRTVDKTKPTYGRHPNVTDGEKSRCLIGFDELAQHSSSSDLWVAIHDKVYDLTEFVHEHPGGATVISQLAGMDATAGFTEAGHSARARDMMEQYVVAHMTPHGYDQKDDEAVIPHYQGDISKKFEFGKRYSGYDHPFTILIVVSVVAVYLLSSALESESGKFKSTEELLLIITSLLLYSLLACFALLFWCEVFVANSLERWIGFSDTSSTNPPLSILAYTFSTFSAFNGVLLLMWVASDVCILSNAMANAVGISNAISNYRISCMISVSAELCQKAWNNSRCGEGYGHLPLAAVFVCTATVLDLVYFYIGIKTESNGIFLLAILCVGAICRISYARSVHYFSTLFNRRDPDFTGPGTGCSNYLLIISSVIVATSLSFFGTIFFKCYGNEGASSPGIVDLVFNMFSLIFEVHDLQWLLACGCSGLCFMLTGSLIRESNATFTSLSRGIGLTLFLWYSGPSYGYAAYISLIVTIIGLNSLSKETTSTLMNKGVAAPKYLYTEKQHEYFWRHRAAMIMHFLIGMPLGMFLHYLSPENEVNNNDIEMIAYDKWLKIIYLLPSLISTLDQF